MIGKLKYWLQQNTYGAKMNLFQCVKEVEALHENVDELREDLISLRKICNNEENYELSCKPIKSSEISWSSMY